MIFVYPAERDAHVRAWWNANMPRHQKNGEEIALGTPVLGTLDGIPACWHACDDFDGNARADLVSGLKRCDDDAHLGVDELGIVWTEADVEGFVRDVPAPSEP